MRRTLLILGWLFAGGLCVKADVAKKQFKVKRKSVTRKNITVTGEGLAGHCIAGDEVGTGAVSEFSADTGPAKLYGYAISGDKFTTDDKFSVHDEFVETETVTIDRSMILGDELSLDGSRQEPEAVNHLYVEHIAQTVVVGDELGIIDEITKRDSLKYRAEVKAVSK